MNNNTWTSEDGAWHCIVRILECTHGQMPVTMTLKVTPGYAASPSQVFFAPDNKGAVISGGHQHVGLAIVGTELLPSFSFSVSQSPDELHPSVVAHVTLDEGERLLFA